MARPRRSQSDTWFHVVNRGLDHGTIFRDDRDRAEFERLIGVVSERFGVSVHLFCWMTNHYHLVVSCPEGVLSDAMHLIGSLYVRHFNDRVGRDGPLFKDRFYAKPVRDDEYFVRLIRYVHRNPLAIAGVRHPVDYRWSSLRCYAGHRRKPPWMRTDVVLDRCGGASGVESMSADLAPELPVLSTEAIVDAIALARWMRADEAPSVRGDRLLATLLLDELAPVASDALAARLDFATDDARRQAIGRARRRLSRSAEVQRLLAEVRAIAA